MANSSVVDTNVLIVASAADDWASPTTDPSSEPPPASSPPPPPAVALEHAATTAPTKIHPTETIRRFRIRGASPDREGATILQLEEGVDFAGRKRSDRAKDLFCCPNIARRRRPHILAPTERPSKGARARSAPRVGHENPHGDRDRRLRQRDARRTEVPAREEYPDALSASRSRSTARPDAA